VTKFTFKRKQVHVPWDSFRITNLNTAGGHNQETHCKGALLIQVKTLM